MKINYEKFNKCCLEGMREYIEKCKFCLNIVEEFGETDEYVRKLFSSLKLRMAEYFHECGIENIKWGEKSEETEEEMLERILDGK